ncbi:DUF1508 domain-containing protein [Amycolatopsis sp. NPDC059021]|uniref:DUF1508 domain-containing protein n=1 Tax=Amycolatopsis sp. NPDC059021 TaxID=3346704 RepID=UPI00366D9854
MSRGKKPRFQLVQTGSETLRWRLLGGNNTSLGTSALDYHRTEDCLASISWLGAHLDDLTAEFGHAGGGRWRWRLRNGTEAVAVAAHAYGRRIEAQRGLDRFRTATGEATTDGRIETITDWRKKYRMNSRENSERRNR